MSTLSNPSRAAPRVAVVGGGVIGLAIAWRLGQKGLPVTVFEAGKCGQEASWAAAGMLAAQIEAEPTEAGLLPLARESQRLWPDFAVELERAAGIAVGYRDEGTMMVALTRDDAEKLRFTHDLHRRMDLPISWLAAADVLAREPHLNPRLSGGLFSPLDGQVDNRRVATALVAACRGVGCDTRENSPVDGVEIVQGRIVGLRQQRGDEDPAFLAADIVVMAAGAWSGRIKGLPINSPLPVRPVKGQMLALRMDPSAPLLRHVVWAPNCYMVPRRDGRLIVGATTEERGFDRTQTAGAMLALLDGAWRALPGVEELAVDEFWCGFRPGSRDDLPILGTTGTEGLIIATGHHRNGILLTPITAQTIAETIVAGTTPELIRPFSLDRFHRLAVPA